MFEKKEKERIGEKMIGKKIEEELLKLFKYNDFNIEKVNVHISNRPDLCDYQCNDIFKLSKEYHLSPIELGEKIVNNIPKEITIFQKIEFVKPGFLNLSLSDEFINQNLTEIMNSSKLGLEDLKKKDTYVIDYGGPNVAKPLHVGHMRTAIVGESIKRIIKFIGHNVISDIHLGDYGLQIGQVIYGLKEENISIDNIDISILNRLYPKISSLCKENDEIKETCASITKQLQDGSKEYQAYWEKIMEVSIADMKKLYDYLGVHFDYWYGESDAYKYLFETEKLLEEKQLLIPSQKALIVDVKKEDDKKEIPPLLFKKSNGAYLYASTDLATIYQRVIDFKPQHILYVVDNRQDMHFEQVFRTCEKAKLFSYDNLEFLGYGTVNGSDGKPFKTRNGDAPSLEDLFAQTKEIFTAKKEDNKNMSEEDKNIIVNAILKFADLSNSREKDYIFDLNKFADVVGKTGPYILYTYVRMNKIIKEVTLKEDKLSNHIYNDIDRDLRLKILEVSSVINSAFETRKPSFIADYVYNLCVVANSFYQNNHIINCDNKEKQNDWIYVLTLMNKIIKELLNLLAIDIPSKM